MFTKIMVCLDGSDLAEQILPYATEEALRFDSKLILFRVFFEPSITSIGIPGFPAIPTETSGMEKRAQKEESESMSYLQSVADRLVDEKGLQAECVTTFGGAGQAIIKYAAENEVDLIAIATHGRSGLERAVIGSVADFVIRHTRQPVLLIRPSQS